MFERYNYVVLRHAPQEHIAEKRLQQRLSLYYPGLEDDVAWRIYGTREGHDLRFTIKFGILPFLYSVKFTVSPAVSGLVSVYI
jgi:hypothetical protein